MKHTNFLCLSNLSLESALTVAELDYRGANVDLTIQQHLMASSEAHSVELFDFIMATDIGLFIFLLVKMISHQVLTESTHWHTDLSLPESSQSPLKTHVHKKGHWFKWFWDPLRKSTRKDK